MAAIRFFRLACGLWLGIEKEVRPTRLDSEEMGVKVLRVEEEGESHPLLGG